MALAILRQDVLTAPVGTDLKVFLETKLFHGERSTAIVHCGSCLRKYSGYFKMKCVAAEEREMHLLCKSVEVMCLWRQQSQIFIVKCKRPVYICTRFAQRLQSVLIVNSNIKFPFCWTINSLDFPWPFFLFMTTEHYWE